MDGSDSVLRGHVVACALPFWGHTKSLCVILSKLVQLRPMYATLFTEVSVLDKVENELRMQFPSESQRSLKERIRVVVLPSPESPFRLDGFQTYFLDAYKTLYDGGASHIVYNTVPPPRLVILDFFFYKALNGVHAISGSSVPVYAWQTGAVAALVYLFGPESMGGNGDIAEKISKITGIDTETQNKEIEEASSLSPNP
ncbi:uncharacterized protein FOMMEDRAFT_157801 [Fomitiporia mediterranea MF3/22]|uniref:uncharacterized protein n=1 Tax=Fomitiporia mediterranea (strain MF3/22) TaxID=694068 RepID=UPI000440999B|nr:uncharacterized protein FOMMEDRAFT_157801 [Fomitiporia mediterranea MF3/22]EJD00704.1 hypothetical protein FOMMEDRAFT_157801 [Fomitiporia mediterranea MF3/22]